MGRRGQIRKQYRWSVTEYDARQVEIADRIAGEDRKSRLRSAVSERTQIAAKLGVPESWVRLEGESLPPVLANKLSTHQIIVKTFRAWLGVLQELYGS